MPSRLWRAGRSAAAAAVGVMLLVSAVSAAGDGESSSRAVGVAAVIKAPVLVMTRVAVAQARLEHDLSSTILHAGVDLFTRALHWISHRAQTTGLLLLETPDRERTPAPVPVRDHTP